MSSTVGEAIRATNRLSCATTISGNRRESPTYSADGVAVADSYVSLMHRYVPRSERSAGDLHEVDVFAVGEAMAVNPDLCPARGTVDGEQVDGVAPFVAARVVGP